MVELIGNVNVFGKDDVESHIPEDTLSRGRYMIRQQVVIRSGDKKSALKTHVYHESIRRILFPAIP